MEDNILKLINTTKNEVGYLEKGTNAYLDEKIKNYGYKNYTKYARDVDSIKNFYNGKKQGYPWCSVFVAWCFIKTFGIENAQKLLCYPKNSLGAGCSYALRYFKNNNQYFKSPKKGDIIFFTQGHTGIVTDVKEKYVYTVEGNTTNKEGIYPNGGGVYEKCYSLNNKDIIGYGRPNYNLIAGTDNNQVGTDNSQTGTNNVETGTNNEFFGYKIGKCNAYYKSLKIKAIRREPNLSENVKRVREISKELRPGLTSKNMNDKAHIKKGCVLTALEFYRDKNGLIWLRNYDGWLVACESNGQKNIIFFKNKK